jgi:hypothetical protein
MGNMGWAMDDGDEQWAMGNGQSQGNSRKGTTVAVMAPYYTN